MEIVERRLGHFEKVHPDYATGVRAALSALSKPSGEADGQESQQDREEVKLRRKEAFRHE
jgi:hypothetical protein